MRQRHWKLHRQSTEVSIKFTPDKSLSGPASHIGFGIISCREQWEVGPLTELVSIVELGAAELESTEEVA